MTDKTVTIGETTFDHLGYDRDADVLYLSVGEPRPPDHTFGTPEGHAVRLDRDRRVIGITLVNPRVSLERGGLRVTLLEVVEVDRSEPRKPSVADDSSRGEFDGLVVAVAVSKGVPELVVEARDVGVFQATAHLDHVPALVCGLGHESEHAAVCGPSDLQRSGVEHPERARR